MDKIISIYKSNGNYLGFIDNDTIFSRDGIYLGWLERKLVWDKFGKFRGVLINIGEFNYIVNDKFSIPAVSRSPKESSNAITIPDPPKNIPPITLSVGLVDAF